MNVYTELRMRSRVADAAIAEQIAGKVPGDADYDVLLTGPVRVLRPDGKPLCVYLPGAVAAHAQDDAIYGVLHSLRGALTKNRGLASGTKRLDPMGQQRYCRLTAWTGQHLPEWETLRPLLQAVAGHLAEHVPDRYANQAARAAKTNPAWVVPGTPFTTITVNNTYPTGVHTDKGDLDEGFSTIATLRRGDYSGGRLIFPAYRVAVDMHDGDLILMDAHEWHGNTPIVCGCGTRLNGPCPECGAERISVVSYYRTKVAQCGSPEQELERARTNREKT